MNGNEFGRLVRRLPETAERVRADASRLWSRVRAAAAECPLFFVIAGGLVLMFLLSASVQRCTAPRALPAVDAGALEALRRDNEMMELRLERLEREVFKRNEVHAGGR